MKKQAPLEKAATNGKGPMKNTLMEVIESVPAGTKSVPSRYNPVGDKCDA